MADKPHMNLVFIGHVDHGKSTTVGRLLLDTGHIDAHVIEKYRQEADAIGKGSFEFAWVMDGLAEERRRGLTIDVAHKRFDTPKYYFTIIDAPGHRDFVKNMITGTSQADAAVIVVSCPDGPQEQTKEHVFLARTLGVPEIIVAINKMDSVNYAEAKFEEAKEKMSKLLATVGFRAKDIPFIPVSAFKGDNATKDKGELKWWNGPTQLEALDNLTAPDKPTDKALRLPVQDVYSITGIGTVPVGRVETGVM
ncbi:MAG: GTP-binding protein, partial [Candidatus Thermoplasmatota archaeon]|nr:GTP-binding protein [Candidatus Thermoplasmatota archaeon]